MVVRTYLLQENRLGHEQPEFPALQLSSGLPVRTTQIPPLELRRNTHVIETCTLLLQSVARPILGCNKIPHPQSNVPNARTMQFLQYFRVAQIVHENAHRIMSSCECHSLAVKSMWDIGDLVWVSFIERMTIVLWTRFNTVNKKLCNCILRSSVPLLYCRMRFAY